MKKLLITVIIIIMFTMSACEYSETHDLAINYDFDNRKCNISNISENTDFEDLKITVILDAKGNFSKEIVFDIGTLNSGDTYEGDLSYISEDIEVKGIYIKSYEYYENEVLKIFVFAVLVVALIFVGIIFI